MPDSTSSFFFRDLTSLNRKLRTRFDARAVDIGVTQSRARLLLLLSRCDGPTQAYLADALEVERPTMARMLDGLEEGGLVRREISSEDRRQRHVYLTEAARSQVDAIVALTDGLREEVTQGVAPEDLETAHRVLRHLLENLAKMDHP